MKKSYEMEIKIVRELRVSKNYCWHEKDGEFEDLRTGVRRRDCLYEAKVDVYEDRVKTWFLHWGVDLCQYGPGR